MKQQSDIYMCTRDKMWVHLCPVHPVQPSLTDDYKGGRERERRGARVRERERERERVSVMQKDKYRYKIICTLDLASIDTIVSYGSSLQKYIHAQCMPEIIISKLSYLPHPQLVL